MSARDDLLEATCAGESKSWTLHVTALLDAALAEAASAERLRWVDATHTIDAYIRDGGAGCCEPGCTAILRESLGRDRE